MICLRKRVLLQPLNKIPRVYRVFTKEVNCFRNAYFGMTVEIYKDIYLVWLRNCQNLCGTLHGQDVCSFCHRASVDAAARLLPLSFKHVCCKRQLPPKCIISIRRCLLAKVAHTPNPYFFPIKINPTVLDPDILGATLWKDSPS